MLGAATGLGSGVGLRLGDIIGGWSPMRCGNSVAGRVAVGVGRRSGAQRRGVGRRWVPLCRVSRSWALLPGSDTGVGLRLGIIVIVIIGGGWSPLRAVIGRGGMTAAMGRRSEALRRVWAVGG